MVQGLLSYAYDVHYSTQMIIIDSLNRWKILHYSLSKMLLRQALLQKYYSCWNLFCWIDNTMFNYYLLFHMCCYCLWIKRRSNTIATQLWKNVRTYIYHLKLLMSDQVLKVICSKFTKFLEVMKFLMRFINFISKACR